MEERKLSSLEQVLSQGIFSEDDKVGSELDSVIAVLERHGYPLDMKQVRALAYAKVLCPESEMINKLGDILDAGRYHAIDPGLFLEALDKYTLADRVTGRLPLNKAFNSGSEKK